MKPEEIQLEIQKFTLAVNRFATEILPFCFEITENKEAANHPQYTLENFPLYKRIEGAPDFQGKVEIGTKYGFIHIHAILFLSHRLAAVRLNYAKIQHDMKELLYPTVYVNIQKFRDTVHDIQSYINKTVTDVY